jgi:hypothetical protein
MAPPVKIQYDQTDDQAMNKYFEQAKANKITFMLYIEDANNSRHGLLASCSIDPQIYIHLQIISNCLSCDTQL